MSVDLYLRCKSQPSRKQVEAIIIPLGWERAENSPGYKGLSYVWFHQEQFESTRGCWLFINRNPKDAPKGTQTVFHTYSNAGRSYEDLEAQNNVLRALRKAFGGSIYNPQERNGSYLENDIPQLSPAEKACGMAYINFNQNLARASLIIGEVGEHAVKMSKLIPFALSFDKGILQNNTAIPFLVATLESFLKDFFIVYIDFQPNIQERIYEKKSKLEYSQLKEIIARTKTLGELEAEEYTFQNLLAANIAYKKYIDLDIFDILNLQIEYKSEKFSIREVITEMIELRHNIIHSAYIDLNLGKDKMEKYIFFLHKFADLFIQKFLDERHFRINLDRHI